MGLRFLMSLISVAVFCWFLVAGSVEIRLSERHNRWPADPSEVPETQDMAITIVFRIPDQRDWSKIPGLNPWLPPSRAGDLSPNFSDSRLARASIDFNPNTLLESLASRIRITGPTDPPVSVD